MNEGHDNPQCQATRYDPRPCEGPVKFDVIYYNANGVVLHRHPACFRHALAEVDRHHASAGIARCEFLEVR